MCADRGKTTEGCEAEDMEQAGLGMDLTGFWWKITKQTWGNKWEIRIVDDVIEVLLCCVRRGGSVMDVRNCPWFLEW